MSSLLMGYAEREFKPFPHNWILLDKSEIVVDMERIHKSRYDGTLGVLGLSLIISVQIFSDNLLKDDVSWMVSWTFSSTTADIESPRLTKELLMFTVDLVTIFKVNTNGINGSQTFILFFKNLQQGRGYGYRAILGILWTT